ncbi:MAG: L-seryl-tRNA(Sec) selenium transferase [Gemmatimonadota bacterium]|nr:MAG: L-seryl-tRNA(Sec) selenium transferase [Gemmatimonadota bacterium]
MTDPRERIPAVERLLDTAAFKDLCDRFPRQRIVVNTREAVAEVRALIEKGSVPDDLGDPARYAADVARRMDLEAVPSLRPVINATGVVLHTNLGRAPLADAAREAMVAVATGYSNLEFELEEGTRGSRYDHCVGLLTELTEADDALVVNNNAAALVLGVNTLARSRDVLVSRGELVEIGGGFRIPEILERAGANLREVGSTNRTRLEDYREAAAGGTPAMILKVHRSNFRMTGFTEEATVEELAGLAQDLQVPLLHDLGSGLMVDALELGLPVEPRPRDSLRAGADIVAVSGDKLLGGPQAGILLGAAELIREMRGNPLCRALRVDKGTLAALEATLRLYRDPEQAVARIPTLRMLAASADDLRERSSRLAGALAPARVAVEVGESGSMVGGGTFPGVELPGWALRIVPRDLTPKELARRLRTGEPPVVGRVEDEALVLDLRTVHPDHDAAIADALRTALDDG